MRVSSPCVLVIPLFIDTFVETDGTTSYTYTEADAPQLLALGPQIESVRVLTVTRNRTTNFNWAIAATTSLVGRTWSTPTPLHADVTANGEAIQTEYTTTTTLCALNLKVVLAVRNGTGAARESGMISAWLVVRLKT